MSNQLVEGLFLLAFWSAGVLAGALLLRASDASARRLPATNRPATLTH